MQGKIGYAANMGIAASGARRWNNRHRFATRQQLLAGRTNPGKSSYLQIQNKTEQGFRAGRFPNIPPAAIPVR